MGRGDARTRKGKIFKGSYGKSRPHKVKKPQEGRTAAAKTPARRGS
jgi:30S ribosomal protein S31